jgi:hypothetical protein
MPMSACAVNALSTVRSDPRKSAPVGPQPLSPTTRQPNEKTTVAATTAVQNNSQELPQKITEFIYTITVTRSISSDTLYFPLTLFIYTINQCCS